MDDRKFMILQAIIDDYIMTAVPVGSRTISRKSGVGFSPATIRNEMSDLEELGYLDQPHTSAGRIPSAKAYRLYVDHLMKMVDLSKEDTERIQDHLNRRTAQMEEVIRQAAQTLSDVTHYTAVVSAPTMQGVTIKRIQLVPVTEDSALMVIVTSAGLVKERVIPVPDGAESDQLYRLSKMLTERLSGCTLTEAREKLSELFSDLGEHRQLMGNVLGALDTQLGGDASMCRMSWAGGQTCCITPSTATLRRPETSSRCWNRATSSRRCSETTALNSRFGSARKTRCRSFRIARSLRRPTASAITPPARWASLGRRA